MSIDTRALGGSGRPEDDTETVALTVPCRVCEQPVGERCRRLAPLWRLGYAHDARIARAMLAEAARASGPVNER